MEQFSKRLEQIAQMDDPEMQEILSKLKKLYGTIQYDNSAHQDFIDTIVKEYQATIQNSDNIIDDLAAKIADLSIANYESDKEKQTLRKQARQLRVEINDLNRQIEQLQESVKLNAAATQINSKDINIKLTPELFSRVVNFVAINQNNFVEAQQLYNDLLACSETFIKLPQNDKSTTNWSIDDGLSDINQSKSNSSSNSSINNQFTSQSKELKNNKKGEYSRPEYDSISELIQNRRRKYKNSEQLNEAFDDLMSVLRLFN